MDHLDEEESVREVFARFGLAVYCCQVVEESTYNLLAVIRVARGSIPPDEVGKNFYDLRYRRRLVDLIKEVRDDGNASADLLTALDAARADRNELAHGYFRKRAATFMTSAGQRTMVDELTAMQERFEATENRLREAFFWLGHRFGLTEDRMLKAQAQLLSQSASP